MRSRVVLIARKLPYFLLLFTIFFSFSELDDLEMKSSYLYQSTFSPPVNYRIFDIQDIEFYERVELKTFW